MDKIIKNGKLENNVFYFPDIQMDRKEYLKIAKHLEFSGGKWNRGKKGFVFDREIESIEELMGDNIKTKKDIQFFATPKNLADKLVAMADLREQDTILEPSAGRGAIIEAIRDILPSKTIQYCEMNTTNNKYLKEIKNIEMVCEDFLSFNEITFDKIIANPPFSNNQDVEHIKQMYSLLRNNGILVSIASKHWQLSNNKTETNFRNWLKEVSAEIIELDGGEFKASGTMIQGVIIKIQK